MYKYILIILLFNYQFIISQNVWISKKYGYHVEIPKGFKTAQATGINVDFKAVNNGNSIIIVVKKLSAEEQKLTLWQGIGDLDEYSNNLEISLQEFLNSPQVIKYGKTKINNKDAFWIDYTSDNGTYYYKNYSLKKGAYIFTITLFADTKNWNYYSAIWFRFKEQIKF